MVLAARGRRRDPTQARLQGALRGDQALDRARVARHRLLEDALGQGLRILAGLGLGGNGVHLPEVGRDRRGVGTAAGRRLGAGASGGGLPASRLGRRRGRAAAPGDGGNTPVGRGRLAGLGGAAASPAGAAGGAGAVARPSRKATATRTGQTLRRAARRPSGATRPWTPPCTIVRQVAPTARLGRAALHDLRVMSWLVGGFSPRPSVWSISWIT